jgi:queuine tRNA-ribosyltransferase
MPTRNARNAQAFTRTGRIRLRNTDHRLDTSPIDPECECYACRNFSRGALRHLFLAKEMLGPILVTVHNLRFFADLSRRMRCAIENGEFEQRSEQLMDDFYKSKKDS